MALLKDILIIGFIGLINHFYSGYVRVTCLNYVQKVILWIVTQLALDISS